MQQQLLKIDHQLITWKVMIRYIHHSSVATFKDAAQVNYKVIIVSKIQEVGI